MYTLVSLLIVRLLIDEIFVFILLVKSSTTDLSSSLANSAPYFISAYTTFEPLSEAFKTGPVEIKDRLLRYASSNTTIILSLNSESA